MQAKITPVDTPKRLRYMKSILKLDLSRCVLPLLIFSRYLSSKSSSSILLLILFFLNVEYFEIKNAPTNVADKLMAMLITTSVVSTDVPCCA